MPQYEIIVETADELEILEQNYEDFLISIITNCIREASENEESSNIS